MSVSRLAEPLDITLTAVGQHLKVLKKGSLVKTQKSGRVRSCSLNPAGFSLLQLWIAEQSSVLEKKLDQTIRLSDFSESLIASGNRYRFLVLNA